MSFATDWDIGKYRVGYESEEHWELRKKFLVKHKNKYPEDKLVCLAQVFYNVEFLGCRYPKATMKMVENLSEGIVEDHREKMKNRLKRTFVGASDAASSKVKGLKRPAAAAGLDNSSGNPVTGASNLKPTESKHIKFEPATQDPPTTILTNPIGMLLKSIQFEQVAQVSPDTSLTDKPTTSKKKKKKKKKSACNQGNILPTIKTELPESPEAVIVSEPATSSVDNFSANKFQDVILYFREEDSWRDKINTSFTFNKVPYELSSEFVDKLAVHQSCIKIFGVEVGSGRGDTAVLAQDAAANAAITYLSKHCYTILLKNPFVVERKIERYEIMDCQPSNVQKTETVSDDKASRMMKMMGWTGGGLGKEEQGRTEPVMPVHQSKRAGVGSAVGKIKINHLRNILQDFMKSGSTHDVIFSTDFDNAERKEIHMVAHRLGLKSQSRSKGENRFLVVSRKWAPKVLLSVLRDSRNRSEKYILLPPNSSEEVAAVSEQQRAEESVLHDLQEERNKILSEEKRARADQDIAFGQYQEQLKELEEDMNKYREGVTMSEVNEKVLTALQDLVAQKNEELVALRRDKQWPSEAKRFCTPAFVNSALSSQILTDLRVVNGNAEKLVSESRRLYSKRIEVNKIARALLAYTETEKSARLDMECSLNVLRIERRKEQEAAATASHQVRPIRLENASSFAVMLKQSENCSASLKELQEEKLLGARLTNEISEVVMQATKYAAERENWVKKQFS